MPTGADKKAGRGARKAALAAIGPTDPRYFQIAVLTALVVYGVGWLAFDTTWRQIVATMTAALAAQYSCARIFGPSRFDPRSPMISGLSLCLLLRTSDLAWAVVTAALAIASKFTLRWRGKHIFNPTNFGLVAMLSLTDRIWVSPGQWGSEAYFGFLLAGLGGLVVHRAARNDVTYAFLLSYAGILLGRAFWLGDPLSIPLHQLRSGAFLIFSFYMISDPKTTPDSRLGRILFAVLVAASAAYVRFGLYNSNGLIWSLALWSPAVPLIDRLLPGRRYEWAPIGQSEKGASHEVENLAGGHSAQPAG